MGESTLNLTRFRVGGWVDEDDDSEEGAEDDAEDAAAVVERSEYRLVLEELLERKAGIVKTTVLRGKAVVGNEYDCGGH